MIEHLRQQGRIAVATRELRRYAAGEKLRALLLTDSMHLETEALLMFAARREHMRVIEPALARGEWVVATVSPMPFAYQEEGADSAGRNWKNSHWVMGDLQPDLTLIFDAPAAVAQQRLHAATAQPDRLSRNRQDFSSAYVQPSAHRQRKPRARADN